MPLRFAVDTLLLGNTAIGFGFLFQTNLLKSVVTEDGNGLCHLPDFILAVLAFDRRCRLALSKRNHPFAQGCDRCRDPLGGNDEGGNDTQCEGDADDHQGREDGRVRLVGQCVTIDADCLDHTVQKRSIVRCQR